MTGGEQCPQNLEQLSKAGVPSSTPGPLFGSVSIIHVGSTKGGKAVDKFPQ